ncbi:hypothetical protein CBOM_03470 [Ceraceosorus bombacis]|uniref:Uncharacterized protein n=1 Tax=Ceraceosorus bombacis TaxID=401625 RepID=A0A0P1BNW3_9BASI|nr:hypothetical protein CBOM_03470 [Ceraceosorus bombacis]
MRSYEIEQAAHAFRARLELASLKAARGWAALNVEELDGSTPTTSSFAQISEPLAGNRASSKAAEELDMSASAETGARISGSEQGGRIGLGIGPTAPHGVHINSPSRDQSTSGQPQHNVGAEAPATSHDVTLPSSPKQRSVTSTTTAASPDLFAMVLGDANLTLNLTKPESRSTPATPTKPLPVKGTSRTLHMLASSPQLGSTARTGGTGRIPPHFDPHNNTESHPRTPAHGSSSRRQTLASPALDSHKRAPSGTAPSTPSRGTLPNGHAASSLAYDLGLARESGTPKRTGPLNSEEFGDLSVRAKQQGRVSVRKEGLVNQNQTETDRVAAVLASMADKRADSSMSPPSKPREMTPGRAPFGSGGAITRANGSFADPNSFTPRGRTPSGDPHTPSMRSKGGAVIGKSPSGPHSVKHSESPRSRYRPHEHEDGETAAQLMLYLAHSPSPAQEAKFKGATPSLRNDLRPSATSQRLAHAVVNRSSESSAEGAVRARSTIGRALWSDSEDEPNSDGMLASEPSSQESTASRLAPAAPLSFDALPRSRNGIDHIATGQMAEAAFQDGDKLSQGVGDADGDHDMSEPERRSSTASMSTSPDRSSSSQRAPTTPPRVLEAPTTPGAPGPKRAVDLTNPSDFSLQDFLNVSPSPKPRSRLHSGQFTPSSTQLEGGVWLDAPTSSWNLGHGDEGVQGGPDSLATMLNTQLQNGVPLRAHATPPRPLRSRFSTLDHSQDGFRSLLDSGFSMSGAGHLHKSPRLREMGEEEDTPSKKRRRIGLFPLNEEASE